MEDTLKHLRAVHFLLVLTACVTTYFSFAQNSEPKKLVSELIRFMRDGPYEYATFNEMGYENLDKFPTIRRNIFRLGYRKFEEIPEIIIEIEGSGEARNSILGIQLVSTHTLTIGPLVQLFILFYLYVVILNARTSLDRVTALIHPVPWIGAMEHRLARVLTWVTIFLIPTISSTFAFLYYPSFLGIALVSSPIAIIGLLTAKESRRLTTAINFKNNLETTK